MAKPHEPKNRTVRASRPRVAKRGAKPATSLPPSREQKLTPESYPKMSASALAFARQMRANPHVRAVMRDLAGK